jgi:hypothetical protein
MSPFRRANNDHFGFGQFWLSPGERRQFIIVKS